MLKLCTFSLVVFLSHIQKMNILKERQQKRHCDFTPEFLSNCNVYF